MKFTSLCPNDSLTFACQSSTMFWTNPSIKSERNHLSFLDWFYLLKIRCRQWSVHFRGSKVSKIYLSLSSTQRSIWIQAEFKNREKTFNSERNEELGELSCPRSMEVCHGVGEVRVRVWGLNSERISLTGSDVSASRYVLNEIHILSWEVLVFWLSAIIEIIEIIAGQLLKASSTNTKNNNRLILSRFLDYRGFWNYWTFVFIQLLILFEFWKYWNYCNYWTNDIL